MKTRPQSATPSTAIFTTASRLDSQLTRMAPTVFTPVMTVSFTTTGCAVAATQISPSQPAIVLIRSSDCLSIVKGILNERTGKCIDYGDESMRKT